MVLRHRADPLTEVFAIEFTVPIWTALFATLVLGERMSTRRALASAWASWVFGDPASRIRSGQPGGLAVLGGTVGYAISHVFTKRLSATRRR